MLPPLLLVFALQTAPAAGAPAKPADDTAGEIPHGAPTDDYGFTAWCRGALSGHMELYPAVKAELQKVEEEKAAKEDARYTTDAEREAALKRRTKEALDDITLDEQQLAAGRIYLKLYTEAITAAEAASASNLRARGEAAQDAGFRIWAAARGAEPRTKMWSWVMWELPARCENAAKRLLDRSSLLAGALKPQPVAERKIEAKAELPAATLEEAKPAEARLADAKPDDAKPTEGAKPEGAVTESKLDEIKAADAKPGEGVEARPAEPPKAAEPAPPEEPPAAKLTPAEPSTPSVDGPVLRRRLDAPPLDAPDAPRPDPKP